MSESTSSRPIRICLAVLPEVARGVLRDVLTQRDVEVVDVRDGALPPSTTEDGCDVIVTNAARAAKSLDVSLQGPLRRSSRNTLFVTIDGALVMMFEFRPRQRLIDPAPDALLAAIRDEVAAMKRGER